MTIRNLVRLIGSAALAALLFLAVPGQPGQAAAAGSTLYLPVVMQDAPSPHDLTFTALSDSTDAELGSLNCTSWAACRTTLYANYWLNGSTDGMIESSFAAASGKFSLKRVFLFFNTSALPDNAAVASAKLRFYSGPNQGGSNLVHVVRTTASTPPGPSSFGTAVLTSGGSAAAGASQWVEIPLKPAALAWIHKAGFTRLALVHELDLTGAAPGGLNYVTLSMWETAGKEPQLIVTYVLMNP